MLAAALAKHGSVHVGKGALKKLPAALRKDRVQRMLLLTSIGGHDRIGRYLEWLCQSQNIQVVPYAMAHGNLSAKKFVDEALVVANRTGCQGVVAAGGGAVLDVAKMTAACMSDDRLLSELTVAAEDPSRITAGDIPFYAVPTNFGTGSEVTGDAVLIDNKTGEPISLRSEYLRSAGIFVDKENFVGLSSAQIHYAAVTAASHGVCNAASNHILMQELNVTSDAEDDVTVIGLAAEAVQYAERVLRDDAPSSNKDIDTCFELAYGSIATGLAADAANVKAAAAGSSTPATNAALVRTVAGSIAEHSDYSYSEAVYTVAPAFLKALVSTESGDSDDKVPRFDRATWGIPEATVYWHGVESVLGEQADARLLSVSRPDMTDEQVGAIIDDVVAVIEGGTSAELEALPADISEACTSREVLESLIRARP